MVECILFYKAFIPHLVIAPIFFFPSAKVGNCYKIFMHKLKQTP